MTARLKLVPHPRPSRTVPFGSSRSKRAQQQIAWAIYISEGYLANLHHALANNAGELTGTQKHELRIAIQRAKQNVYDIRELLS